MTNKGKKNKKHQTLHLAIKPFIKDSRVLYALLGAVGTGVALGVTFGSQKGSTLVAKITAVVKQWGQHSLVGEILPVLANKPAKRDIPVKQRKAAKLKKKPKPLAPESF